MISIRVLIFTGLKLLLISGLCVLEPVIGRAKPVFGRFMIGSPQDMIALPVPMIVALLLGYLFLRAILFEKTSRLLAALLLACACQSVTVSLVHYYGFDAIRLLQPVMASMIPALAWMAFLQSSVRSRFVATDLCHFLAPVVMVVVMIVMGIRLAITWSLSE